MNSCLIQRGLQLFIGLRLRDTAKGERDCKERCMSIHPRLLSPRLFLDRTLLAAA